MLQVPHGTSGSAGIPSEVHSGKGWLRGPHQFRVRRRSKRVHWVGRGGTDPSQPQCLPHPRPEACGHRPSATTRSCTHRTRVGSGYTQKAARGRSCSGYPPPGPPDPPTRPADRCAPPRSQAPPLTSPFSAPPPSPSSILGDRRGPARSLAESRLRGGRAQAGPGRGRKVAAARRGGRGALTRMFTPGHPGKWKRRALLRGGEPQTPGPGPPPPPPPW